MFSRLFMQAGFRARTDCRYDEEGLQVTLYSVQRMAHSRCELMTGGNIDDSIPKALHGRTLLACSAHMNAIGPRSLLFRYDEHSLLLHLSCTSLHQYLASRAVLVNKITSVTSSAAHTESFSSNLQHYPRAPLPTLTRAFYDLAAFDRLDRWLSA
jgi:hypothetical protein